MEDRPIHVHPRPFLRARLVRPAAWRAAARTADRSRGAGSGRGRGARQGEAGAGGGRVCQRTRPRSRRSTCCRLRAFFRRAIDARGAVPNIPPKANCRWKNCFSPALYRGRNAIERMLCRLKDVRRVATRYDRLAATYLAAVHIAAIVAFWLRVRSQILDLRNALSRAPMLTGDNLAVWEQIGAAWRLCISGHCRRRGHGDVVPWPTPPLYACAARLRPAAGGRAWCGGRSSLHRPREPDRAAPGRHRRFPSRPIPAEASRYVESHLNDEAAVAG
jgi:transposase